MSQNKAADLEELISTEEQCLEFYFLHGSFLTTRWLTRKFSTCLMTYHETLLMAINYRVITPRFRPLSCIYFRGAIIVYGLNVLVIM